jgi:signal transduction histidine kinase
MLLEGMAGDLTDEQRNYIGTILEKGESLLVLIGQVLDLSRIESDNVAHASSDAEAGASAMRSVETAARGALTTADDVAGLSTLLRGEAEKLDNAIRQFLTQVRAA